MQEKKILVDETGPFIEIKMNDYTTKRRRLTDDELEAFKARQKENLSVVIADAEKEGSEEAPPIIAVPDSVEKVAEKPTPTTKPRARKRMASRVAPSAPADAE